MPPRNTGVRALAQPGRAASYTRCFRFFLIHTTQADAVLDGRKGLPVRQRFQFPKGAIEPRSLATEVLLLRDRHAWSSRRRAGENPTQLDATRQRRPCEGKQDITANRHGAHVDIEERPQPIHLLQMASAESVTSVEDVDRSIDIHKPTEPTMPMLRRRIPSFQRLLNEEVAVKAVRDGEGFKQPTKQLIHLPGKQEDVTT